MDTIFKIILISCFFGIVTGDYCYHLYNGGSYCSGYCYGSYGYEYCDYYWYDYATVGSLSVGAFIGVIIGCLIFLGIFLTVIVLVCCACTKKSGQTGRVIYPANSQTNGGIATTETQFYSAVPSAPHFSDTTYGGSHLQPLSVPYPQTGHMGQQPGGQFVPPPSYSSLSTPNSNTGYNQLPQDKRHY